MEPTERRALQAALVRLAGGDRSAFPFVYAALWPLLLRFTARLLADRAEAEDAAQAALLKLFERASSIDPERDGVAFALGIAAYECRSIRARARRRGAQLPAEVLAGAAAKTATPEEAALAAELTAAAEEALGSLRPADIEVLRAATGADRRLPGTSPATFRKRLQRALERLRAVWRTRHGTD